MNNGWRLLRIQDISSKMADAPFGSNLKTEDYTEKGELVIQGRNIDGRVMKWDDFRFVSKEKFDSLSRHHAKEGAIVFPKVGTIGKVGVLTSYKGRHKYLLSTNTMMFEPDLNLTTSLFIYYFFSNPVTRKFIEHSSTSSVQPVFNFTALKNFKINLPPLPEQKSIAHVLGSLDDKIELNRQMNQTLEAMAQALFKSWFVDFDPVMDNAIAVNSPITDELQGMAEKRSLVPENKKLLFKNPELAALFPSSFVFNETLGKWIPEGWEVKKLQELVSVKYGKDHKKLKEGDIACYGSGGIMRYVEKALFETESVLIPRKGTLDNVMYVNKPFWSVDTMFYTEMKQNNFVKYFFNVMNKLNFGEMNEGSAVPSMTTAQLNAMDILHPSAQCLSEFDTLISKYFSKKEGNEIQIETLTQLRDRLLPELISGKVRVKEKILNNL